MKVIAAVLWGATAIYLYQYVKLNLLPGRKVNLAWEKAPVRQWRE
jgi:hypothetical protein